MEAFLALALEKHINYEINRCYTKRNENKSENESNLTQSSQGLAVIEN